MLKTLRIPVLLALAAGLLALSAPSTAAGGGGCHANSLSDGAATEIRLTQNCFEPGVTRIATGDTITWVSEDTAAHTVTSARNSFGGSGNLYKGDTFTQTFAAEGVFPYYCAWHPGMVGAVAVGDSVPSTTQEIALADASPDDGDGTSTTTVAAIAAAIGLGGAALGMVGTRVVSSRKER